MYHGQGTLTDSNGRKYKGEFTYSSMDYGTYTSPDGKIKYEGGFTVDYFNSIFLYHGQGTLTSLEPAGLKKYEGEYKDGKPHGQVTMIYYNIDGSIKKQEYEGEYKEGKPHGQGTMIFYNIDGSIKKQETYIDRVLISTKEF